MPEEYTLPGALEDTRPVEKKQKDFHSAEVATALPIPMWRTKVAAEWPKYGIRDQDGSGSCVAQTVAKMLAVKNFREEGKLLEFSAVPIYKRRVNAPQAGMIGVNALELATTYGATLEALVPSQKQNDSQMDAQKLAVSDDQIGKIFKQSGFVQIPFNIDTIAAYIEQEGCAMLWFTFDYDEWGDVPATKNNGRTIRHSVTGVDYCLWNGKKAIIIDDSWGKFFGFEGQRVITEDFLKNHIIFAAVLMDIRNDWRELEAPPVQKPIYKFTKDLEFIPLSSTGNPVDMVKHLAQVEDVRHLQEILRYEGFFPTNIDITGYYGALTAKAVYQYQTKYKVAPQDLLDSLAGKRFGPATRAHMNAKYGA